MPYDLTPEFLEELFTKHRIDYVVHGDDPCLLPDGTDAYAHAKKQGRFRMVSGACSSPALNISRLSRDVPSVATCYSPPSNQRVWGCHQSRVSLPADQADGGCEQHRHRGPHADVYQV